MPLMLALAALVTGPAPTPERLAAPPSLVYVFTIEAELGPPQEQGEVDGRRVRFIPITGGRVHGPRLTGTVLAGGDWQAIHSDGLVEVNTRYSLRADDGTAVDIVNPGVRTADPAVTARMARGEPVDPAPCYFRTAPCMTVADGPYGSAETLAWLVHERDIEPHIPVFDKSGRTDGTFSRTDFSFDVGEDAYTCPAGKLLKRRRRRFADRPDEVPADGFFRYRASMADCTACPLKPRCCPGQPMRKVMRSVHEGARDLARALAEEDEWLVSRKERKKVEMLFAHLKRILRLDRLRLRGPNGARDEFHLAAAAQNLRKLAKLIPMPIAPAPA